MAGSNCNESSSQYKAGVTNEGQLVGYFCSDTVFDLSFLQFEIDVPPATNFILGKCTPSVQPPLLFNFWLKMKNESNQNTSVSILKSK